MCQATTAFFARLHRYYLISPPTPYAAYLREATRILRKAEIGRCIGQQLARCAVADAIILLNSLSTLALKSDMI